MRGTLAVYGDSWSDPTYNLFGPGVWAELVARRLGLGLSNAAMGGAGYGRWYGTYPSAFPIQPSRTPCTGADVVIVFGSVNDDGNGVNLEQVRQGAVDTYDAIRRQAPGAVLLVIGPQCPTLPVPATLRAVRDVVRSVASSAGATFADALEWIAGQAGMIGTDNHPTLVGHRALADRITPIVQQILARPVPTFDREELVLELQEARGGSVGYVAPKVYDLLYDPDAPRPAIAPCEPSSLATLGA